MIFYRRKIEYLVKFASSAKRIMIIFRPTLSLRKNLVLEKRTNTIFRLWTESIDQVDPLLSSTINIQYQNATISLLFQFFNEMKRVNLLLFINRPSLILFILSFHLRTIVKEQIMNILTLNVAEQPEPKES